MASDKEENRAQEGGPLLETQFFHAMAQSRGG